MEISSMILRPYISENLLNRRVTKAAAREGIESDQEYRAMPSRSAAILGLAMPSDWMKKLMVKTMEKIAIRLRRSCRLLRLDSALGIRIS